MDQQSEKDKPPSPTLVLVLSLFGYPGVGHFMVGARTLATGFVLVFTALTIGIIYEMWLIAGPLYRMYTQGLPMEMAPNWARIGFWILSTGAVWLASGLHSYVLAKRLQ
ncbi:MAG: hypothetical protein WC314_10030 [Vulcanimicrobiota bacterium]